ncbi:hypothetical protein BIU82_12315 [Arthrobacter sp. SW1]|uniref:COG4315 family predicted lipoprotein n=1 Tax=Arthrobacter sp. SW1 TaxID=1920889 RepID=UPI000877D140|nr:hypothetical protein [Arthrobacter sp. SW1]OFI36875.1 hypothetical protein BIU82_12315 [Arthrobacter sp. SW1]
MKKHILSGLGALALAAALAACGGSPGTSPTSAPPSSSAAASDAPAAAELKTANTTAGDVVVAANGMSVYYFTKDVKDSGKSACEGQCLAAWPPVTTESDAPAVDGVTGTIGTIPTADGKKQITVNGMPVYYFAKDTAPGDVKGQGVNGVWYLVSPSGEMIK